MRHLLEKWGVGLFFRAAYRASEKGIIERSHRTIKSMAESTEGSPLEAVYLYNASPRYKQDPETVPQKSLFTYERRLPQQFDTTVHQAEEGQRIKVGDPHPHFWVKPGNVKYTSRWEQL